MTINKDNVTDYQISHIGSTQEDRLKVCRILESLGQKVGATSFKKESIEYIFKDDILYLDGTYYLLCSPIPSKITVTPKEFIQMATPIPITKKIDEMLSEISGVDLSTGRLTLDNNSIKTLIGIGELSSRTELTPTKGKTMPKTLKDNVVELVQENKAAAFTAAEIKAGQIINQQAISLIKPKLPMMIRGYADSPLASVVLANVVALSLKQYAAGNSKLEKISELMIAGAAFDSINALNLDGLVNDFIAGIKLPAGVEIE